MNTWTLGWPPQLRFMCACSICTVQCPLGPLGPPVLSSPWSGRLRLCRQLTLIYGIGMHSRKPLTSPQNAGSLPIWLRQRLHETKPQNATQFSSVRSTKLMNCLWVFIFIENNQKVWQIYGTTAEQIEAQWLVSHGLRIPRFATCAIAFNLPNRQPIPEATCSAPGPTRTLAYQGALNALTCLIFGRVR